MTERGASEQLRLLRATARRRPREPAAVADVDPVASVVLDVPLAHLDRAFDYAVPASMAAGAVPGARVRARFAGQQVDGFVVGRRPTSEHPGPLSPLTRVVSAEPVLTPEVLRAARAVADACAGTLAEVLRLAVPPRHATAEARRPAADHGPCPPPAPGPWSAYPGGEAFLAHLAAGSAPRAVWTAVPGHGEDDWPHALAVAAGTALAAGRGALLVAPDHRDVARVARALTAVLGEGRHVLLTADVGPAARYRAFLALRRGAVRVVVGTRSAALAPVADLGLVACWDDGDDLHAEPRAPYPHTREILRLRADQSRAAALIGSLARTAQAQQLVDDGWARSVTADRATVRRRTPRMVVAGDDDLRDPAARTARLPSLALRVARAALAGGPVLVQVPRSGYLPAVACQSCRAPARCATCHGPLAVGAAGAVPACRWCGRPAASWRCPRCQGPALRSVVVGSARTAEELGRALPGVRVRTSGGTAPVVAEVGPEPALVVATPGAEPVASGGYTAAVLLDLWAPLARPDLRAAEEALRRWLNAAALVRGGQDGGRVVLVGDATLAPVQAAVRWDPAGHAGRELAERSQLHLPPAAALVEVRGDPDGVQALLAAARLPPGAEVLGPVPVDARAGSSAPVSRALVRAPRRQGGALAAALSTARAGLSARRHPAVPRLRVDPASIAGDG